MRALDGRGQVEPDLSLREARHGDRYLICSDGLSGVVSRETMEDTLLACADPREAVQELIQLALRGGGPDNITCIVADLVDSDQTPSDIPMVVGAVAEDLGDTATLPTTPASRARELTQGEYEAEALVPETPPSRRKPKSAWRRTLPVWGPAVLVLAALGGAYWWTQTQYYVAADGNNVTIYRGIDSKIFGISLSSPYRTYDDIDITQFSPSYQQSLKDHYEATSLGDARKYMDKVRDQASLCATIKDWNQNHPAAVPSQVPQTQSPGQPTPPAGSTPGGESVSPTAPVSGQAAPFRTGTATATARSGSDGVSRSTVRPEATRTTGTGKQNGAASGAPTPGATGDTGTASAPPTASSTTLQPVAPERFDAGEQQDKVSNCAVLPNGSS
jgi:protein phosphatase